MNLFNFTEIHTLKDIKKYLKDNYLNGCKCPACGQAVKAYKRTLNKGMVQSLAIIYNLTKNGNYVHVQNEFSKLGYRATSMDYIQLARWGFIVEDNVPGPNPNKGAGYWKITETGKNFLLNKNLFVSKYVIVYNNRTIEFSKEMVNVEEALGNKFNYNDLSIK